MAQGEYDDHHSEKVISAYARCPVPAYAAPDGRQMTVSGRVHGDNGIFGIRTVTGTNNKSLINSGFFIVAERDLWPCAYTADSPAAFLRFFRQKNETLLYTAFRRNNLFKVKVNCCPVFDDPIRIFYVFQFTHINQFY